MIKVIPLYALSAVAAVLALVAGFTGKRILFIGDIRMAVIVLFAAGFLLCSTGAITSFVGKAPGHPLTIAGYIIGAVALFTGLVQIFGWQVPVLVEPRTALIIITVAILLKVAIARFAYLLPK